MPHDDDTDKASTDWRDLFAEAGARACRRCGHAASFCTTDTGNAPPGGPVPAVWFCFECGYEDASPSVS